MLENAIRHLRAAIRLVRKSPSSSAAIVFTLALGIGGNSAVFSAIHAILLKPLPFPDGDQLMSLQQYRLKERNQNANPFVAPVRVEDWSRLNSTFQAITGYYLEDESETTGELPEKITRAWTTPRFFEVWRVWPVLGRGFLAEEYHLGNSRQSSSVVISDRFWRRRFGGDPSAVGKRIRLEGFSCTIVGIMPASFLFPERDVDVWSPSPMDAPYAQGRGLTWYTVVGRLKPGLMPAQARADLATIQAQLGKQFPKPDAELAVRIRPLKEVAVGGIRRSLWILFTGVSLLLLIACTNVAALLLARTTQREHEISIRYSLGASRMSIVRQLLTEVLLLAVAGSGLALAITAAAARAFHMLSKSLPRADEIRLDGTLVLYSLACAMAVTLASGLLPAIRGTRRSLSGSLAQAGRTQVSGRMPLQWALVGVQVALSVTLLVGAGLLLRSFQALGAIVPGFDANHVLTFRISGNYGETANYNTLITRIDRTLDALRSVPGVEAAATAADSPGVHSEYQVELKVLEGDVDPNQKITAISRPVSLGYFEAMRMPLIAGEACRETTSYNSAVVNRSFAELYLGGSRAVGHHVGFVPSNPYAPSIEIRGIVADARDNGINHEPEPTLYGCLSAPYPTPVFLVRTHNQPMAMADILRRKMREIAPNRSLFEVMPLEQHLSDAFAENRLRTALLSLFAFIAISLACIGLYGTLSYFVNVRRREVGLRLALGAMRGQIVSRFLWQALRVSMGGCLAGLCLAAAFSRLLAGMLYGVTATDATTFAAVILLVACTTAAASLWPAARASSLEPVQVLREE